MQNEAAQYLDFIDEDEQRRRQAKRILFGLLIGLALIAGLCIENGYNTGVVLICTTILFTMLLLVNTANHRKALQREESLLRLLEVNLDLFEGHSYRERLILAAQNDSFEELQVRKNKGAVRGQDEKGFTGGRKVQPLDSNANRRDVSHSDSDYEGLEGELRRSEHLVNEANIRYEKKANEQWQASEASDVDLIEAGVERLGDLVRTEWFEKNAMDGAVDELMGQGQKE
jgi:hypothetical protein